MDGDETAFEKLIQLYRKRLYSFLIRLCGNRDQADDLFQETLIKVWKGLKHYKNQQKFSSWLFTIAYNLTIDCKRKEKTDKTAFFTMEVRSGENISETIETKEAGKIVLSLLQRLPEKQKRVFLLRQHSELSFREISELMNEPINTVISHMNYAVKKIRKNLKEKYEIRR